MFDLLFVEVITGIPTIYLLYYSINYIIVETSVTLIKTYNNRSISYFTDLQLSLLLLFSLKVLKVKMWIVHNITEFVTFSERLKS